MVNKSGYVYLVKSDSGHWKIGHTSNLHDRRRTFNVKLPIEITFVHTITCYNRLKLESELHSVFASNRVDGEWFSLDEVEVNWIKAIKSQIHFDSMMTEPNPYLYRAHQLVEGERLDKMQRSLLFKGGLLLLMFFILLIGVVMMRNEFMTTYVALPIVLSSFAMLVAISSDVLNLYARLWSGTSNQSNAREKRD